MAYFFPHTGKNYTQSIPSQDNNITEKMPTKYMQWIIECLLDTLEEMKEAVVSLPQLSLISSSLLFVYEGDREAAEITWKKMIQQDAKKSTTIEEEEEMPKMCDLRLIDFAQSDWLAQRDQQDQDLVKGFDNTIEILSYCLEKKI